MKISTNVLYGREEIQEMRRARWAASDFRNVARLLERKGFQVKGAVQWKHYVDPILYGSLSHPQGNIDVESEDFSDADRIIRLPELRNRGLNIVGGYGPKDMWGKLWPSSHSFFKDYSEKCGAEFEPDYLVLSTAGPQTRNKLYISVGKFPDVKQTFFEGLKRIIERPQEVSLL
ncbi:MAG: hypothetical protein KC506_00520 [Nanoarchaeota archaeon]|nr:hypothetical protein [Nanoarchaeota archaeon]